LGSEHHEPGRSAGRPHHGELGGSVQTILDAACGIGTQTLSLAQLGYTILGADLSPAAVAQAKREATVHGRQVAWCVADMQHLPLHSISSLISSSPVIMLCRPVLYWYKGVNRRKAAHRAPLLPSSSLKEILTSSSYTL